MTPIRTAWRERVDARVDLLEAEVAPFTAWPKQSTVKELLVSARAASTSKPWWRWWTGAPIERAWRKIHDAEVLLSSVREMEELEARRPEVVALVRVALPEGDPQRAAAERRLADTEWAVLGTVRDKKLREYFIAALRAAFDASDEQYARLRSFRNAVVASAFALLALAAALGVVGIVHPGSLPLCFTTSTNASTHARTFACPSGMSSPSRSDVVLVEGLGVIGGALAATVAIRRLRGTSSPYGVPIALAGLKLPAGALAAFVAMLFFQARFVPGLATLTSQQQILAYAIVFGYAQQIGTGLIDRQAQSVLDKTPTSEPSTS